MSFGLRFGISFNDILAISQLCVTAHQTLESFNSTNSKINELRITVDSLGKTFRKLKQNRYDHLKELEKEELGDIIQVSIDSINVVLRVLESIKVYKPFGSLRLWGRAVPIGVHHELLLEERLGLINQSLFLLQRFIVRTGSGVQIFGSLISEARSYNPVQKPDPGREKVYLEGLNIWDYFNSWLPRSCVLIMIFFATFVALSCFLGVYFTLEKDYGYSMGDAFTLAGWVVAVGAFISSAILAFHRPQCKCWELLGHHEYSHLEIQELQNIFELPG